MGVKTKLWKGKYFVFANHNYGRKAWSFDTKDEAEDFARSVRQGIKDTGKLSAESKSQLPTLSEYFKRFEAGHLKTVKPKTSTSYERAFRLHIEPRLGKKPIDELSRDAVK
ncbi:N-terminal phage integrase SAM-like domain-containing protein, partial [bacterium]|nr:N-terminal phage integrase SAM-like domain-containing protein [bacterium]